MKKPHEFYMKLAIAEAQKAFSLDEVPVGVVIVNSNGEIIAIWCVFLSLKNYNRKILYFVILLFCYFGGYRNTLISASFRLDKTTNLK